MAGAQAMLWMNPGKKRERERRSSKNCKTETSFLSKDIYTQKSRGDNTKRKSESSVDSMAQSSSSSELVGDGSPRLKSEAMKLAELLHCPFAHSSWSGLGQG